MPVFTFSTPQKRPQDEELVKKIKEHCNRQHLNFSAIVVDLLKQYEEQIDAKVQR